MPERHFHPTPAVDRETFGHLKDQLVAGLRIARGRQVVRVFLSSACSSGSRARSSTGSGACRCSTRSDAGSFGGDEAAIALHVFALIGTVVSLAASLASGRWLPRRVVETNPGLPVAMSALVQVVAVVGVALLSGNLWLALACVWLREAAMAFSGPIESTWVNRNLGQLHARHGAVDDQPGERHRPGCGRTAARWRSRHGTSIPVALVVAAVVQAPTVLALLGFAAHRRSPQRSARRSRRVSVSTCLLGWRAGRPQRG